MSRAVNVDATVEAVTKACATHNIGISTIEPLASGGTRVVAMNSDGAAALRRHLKSKILEGTVVRSDLYRARPPLDYNR